MAERKRRARGEGSIRQRPNGSWEARFVVGVDPGTGKDIRKSVYGKTQKEVRKKMTEAIAALDKDDYREPCKMTLGQWLDIWSREYWNDIKDRTCESYECQIRNHIKPCLGAIKLDSLNTHTIQQFYNSLGRDQDEHKVLSSKTVRVVHGVLHKALQQAVENGLLRTNPADTCKLPKKGQRNIKPLDEDATAAFVDAVKGNRFENILLVTVFTGLRRGEVCGLTWDCIDFKTGSILIDKQLQRKTKAQVVKGEESHILVASTKSNKTRTIKPAPFVMDLLRGQRAKQAEWKLKAGACWSGDAQGDFVFTDELGRHLIPDTVYRNLKRVAKSIGLPETRLHDLRHTYTVASIQAGDDVKTVQENLGHATAAFTLEVYAHVTDKMKEASANRMQKYIENIKKSG